LTAYASPWAHEPEVGTEWWNDFDIRNYDSTNPDACGYWAKLNQILTFMNGLGMEAELSLLESIGLVNINNSAPGEGTKFLYLLRPHQDADDNEYEIADGDDHDLRLQRYLYFAVGLLTNNRTLTGLSDDNYQEHPWLYQDFPDNWRIEIGNQVDNWWFDSADHRDISPNAGDPLHYAYWIHDVEWLLKEGDENVDLLQGHLICNSSPISLQGLSLEQRIFWDESYEYNHPVEFHGDRGEQQNGPTPTPNGPPTPTPDERWWLRNYDMHYSYARTQYDTINTTPKPVIDGEQNKFCNPPYAPKCDDNQAYDAHMPESMPAPRPKTLKNIQRSSTALSTTTVAILYGPMDHLLQINREILTKNRCS
jgi:hypothetical protein